MESGQGMLGIPKRERNNQSIVWVSNISGGAATYGTVYIYTTPVLIQGGDMSYIKDLAFGSLVVINNPGLYYIAMQDVGSQVNYITVNTPLSTLQSSSTPQVPYVKAYSLYPANGGMTSTVEYLNAGDVVRPMVNAGGVSVTGSGLQFFKVKRIT